MQKMYGDISCGRGDFLRPEHIIKILNKTGILLWKYYPIDKTFELSENFRRLLELEASDPYIKKEVIFGRIHPDDRERLRYNAGALENNMPEVRFECRFKASADNWISLVLTAQYFKEKKPFFAGTAAENTECGLQESKIRETAALLEETRKANERTQVMLDATPLCCNFWNDKFENIDCNEAAVKLFELKDKQEYLDRFFELSPKYQPCGRASSEMALENIKKAFEEGYCRFEWMHQKLNGDPVPSEITLVRVAWGDGYIVTGYTRDLRELRATLADLDSERALLRRIMNSCPVSFVIAINNIVRYTTPFIEGFLGIKPGDCLSDFYADPEEDERILDILSHSGELRWHRISMLASSGEQKVMLANMVNADYNGECAQMGWFVDITDIIAAEKEMLRAKEIAEQSNRAKNDFLASMSHELKTPMNAILGMISLLQMTGPTAKQAEYLVKTEQSAKSLLTIINDILDYSQIEAGRIEIQSLQFNLDFVFNDILSLLGRKIDEKGLVFSIENNIHSKLKGDPIRLNQILTNIIGNAVKFTEKGRISLKAEIAERNGNDAIIKFIVNDTGIGMNPEQISMLFQPFTQADTSTTRKYGGTGLGLAICKKISGLLGGEIWCESAPGEGSTFFLTLPMEILP